MNADERRLEQGKMGQLPERVIRCAFTVSNTLGRGFLEKVYGNALAHELRKAGLQVQQHGITVYYDGQVANNYGYQRSSAFICGFTIQTLSGSAAGGDWLGG